MPTATATKSAAEQKLSAAKRTLESLEAYAMKVYNQPFRRGTLTWERDRIALTDNQKRISAEYAAWELTVRSREEQAVDALVAKQQERVAAIEEALAHKP